MGLGYLFGSSSKGRNYLHIPDWRMVILFNFQGNAIRIDKGINKYSQLLQPAQSWK